MIGPPSNTQIWPRKMNTEHQERIATHEQLLRREIEIELGGDPSARGIRSWRCRYAIEICTDFCVLLVLSES